MEKSVEILGALAEALSDLTDLQRALHEALRLLSRSVGLESGWVWLRAGEEFYLAAALELPAALVDPAAMTGKSCWCMDGMKKGSLDRRRVTVMECSRLKERGARTRYHATLPLVLGDRPLGILNLAGPQWRSLEDDEVGWLSLAARQIAMAVERAHGAQEQLEREREKERLRLSRDIHDHLAQSLTAIALQGEAALLAPEQSEIRLRRILELTGEALERTRRSMLELRRAEPLLHRLRDEVQRFTFRTGVPVRLRLPKDLELSPSQEEELHAVVVEGLRNVERHAGARSVELAADLQDELLSLTLRDDGSGFEAREVAADRLGLQGMRERVELLGGQLEVRTGEGEGTALVVRVPL